MAPALHEKWAESWQRYGNKQEMSESSYLVISQNVNKRVQMLLAMITCAMTLIRPLLSPAVIIECCVQTRLSRGVEGGGETMKYILHCTAKGTMIMLLPCMYVHQEVISLLLCRRFECSLFSPEAVFYATCSLICTWFICLDVYSHGTVHAREASLPPSLFLSP